MCIFHLQLYVKAFWNVPHQVPGTTSAPFQSTALFNDEKQLIVKIRSQILHRSIDFSLDRVSSGLRELGAYIRLI
jgi:hypothetical protein